MKFNLFSRPAQPQENLEKHTSNVYLCAFGDSRLQKNTDRLKAQARELYPFTGAFYYNETDLPESFVNHFSDYLRPGVRGFGYYLWKPFVVLESLKKIKDNDILFYVDTGCHLNSKGRKRFFEYLDIVSTNQSGFLLTEVGSVNYENRWTKGDLFDYFGVRDKKEITHSVQYQATTIFIRKNPETVSVIERWLKVFYDNMSLADDTPSVSPNLEGFREHRHDQSILSILLKIHGANVISIDECYSRKWKELEKKYPILIKRDLNVRKVKNTPSPKKE